MAIYHFQVKCLSRRKNENAVFKSAYHSAEKLEVNNLGKIADYRKKRQPLHKEILAPDNSPEWVYDRQSLWNAVESAESREDAQVAREVEISLPAELTLEQQIELVRGFAREQFVALGMIADMVINRPPHVRQGDPRNIFAQILLTTRPITSEGFARLKERSWNTKAILERWRVAWEKHANQALASAGRQERIDHRSLEARGLPEEAIDDEFANFSPLIESELKKLEEPAPWRKDYLLVSIPKKYQYLVKAYSIWLQSQPEGKLEEFELSFKELYKKRPGNKKIPYNKNEYKAWATEVSYLHQKLLKSLHDNS